MGRFLEKMFLRFEIYSFAIDEYMGRASGNFEWAADCCIRKGRAQRELNRIEMQEGLK